MIVKGMRRNITKLINCMQNTVLEVELIPLFLPLPFRHLMMLGDVSYTINMMMAAIEERRGSHTNTTHLTAMMLILMSTIKLTESVNKIRMTYIMPALMFPEVMMSLWCSQLYHQAETHQNQNPETHLQFQKSGKRANP